MGRAPTVPFVDREDERRALDTQYAAPGGRFVVVLGRRRLGKSEVLARFCRGKEAAFLFCPRAEPAVALRSLTRDLAQALGDEALAREPSESAEAFVGMVAKYLAAERGRVVVLDEFQNLAAADRAILSFLQRDWDRRIRDSGGMLVLCGSAVGMMEDFAMSPKSPLYGRKTGLLRLEPLPFWAVGRLIPERALLPRLLRYSVAGGVPAYLRSLYPYPRLGDALRAVVFDKGGALREEPPAAIQAETRDPERYLSILEHIAGGAARFGEIADRTGIAVTTLPRYMEVLTDRIRVVERRTVVTEPRAWSKTSVYKISDPFFRFWFACVAPRRSRLEQGDVGVVLSEALERLPALAGPILEDIVRDAMLASYGRVWGSLPIAYDKVGNWWSRRGEEIDLVGLGAGRKAVAVEVKLGIRPVGTAVVESLLDKVALLPLSGRIEKAVVTAGTFSHPARRIAREAGVHTIDGKALSAALAMLASRPRPAGSATPVRDRRQKY